MQVSWTHHALRAFNEKIDYCLENFGKRVALKVSDEIEMKVKRLCQHPLLGHPESLLSHRDRVYRALKVGKHHRLIYFVDENSDVIYITDIWDNRMNPSKLSKRIK